MQIKIKLVVEPECIVRAITIFLINPEYFFYQVPQSISTPLRYLDFNTNIFHHSVLDEQPLFSREEKYMNIDTMKTWSFVER